MGIDRKDLKARKGKIAVLARQQKMKELLTFMEEEIKLFPDDANTFFKYGIVLDYFKQYEKAVEAYTRSNNLQPSPKTIGSIAKIYLRLGKTDEAHAILLEAKKLDPNFEPVQDMLIMLDDTNHKKASARKSSKKKKKASSKKHK